MAAHYVVEAVRCEVSGRETRRLVERTVKGLREALGEDVKAYLAGSRARGTDLSIATSPDRHV